jgi:HK97 family phage major capsid protein
MDMEMEVKADALEGAFDAVLAAEAVDELKASVAALKAQVDAQTVAASRLPLDGAKAADPARDAFVERYLRRGIDAGVEMKSLSGASGGDGGYAVPREIDGSIAATLKTLSPIRSIATVVQTGTSGYRKLIATGSMGAGWVGETAARPETATRSFAEIAPPSGELYANPAASQAMLDDAMFNVEDWLAEQLGREFAVAEGSAFVNGNGTNRPKGFLTYTTTNEIDSVRAFGTLQHLATGTAGAFPASNPQDKLVELVHSLKAPYRQGASWVMNSDTLARIRKFKTSDGAFIWQPGMVEGAGGGGGGGGGRRCWVIRSSRPRICPMSARTACRSRSAIFAPGIWSPTAARRASCAIRSATNPSCISMQPSGSAARSSIHRPSS